MSKRDDNSFAARCVKLCERNHLDPPIRSEASKELVVTPIRKLTLAPRLG
jgi:hypothetical protein